MRSVTQPAIGGSNAAVTLTTGRPRSFSGLNASLKLGLFLSVSIFWFQTPSVHADTCSGPSNSEPVLVQPVEFSCRKPQIVAAVPSEQSLSEMLKMLKEYDLSPEKLVEINQSLKKQIVEFRNQDENSKADIQRFLRKMVGEKNYYRRNRGAIFSG